VSLAGLLCAAISVYLLVLFARAVMSWFPIRPGTAMAQVALVLRDLTEPLLSPLRQVIPPAGMFDLSFLVLMLGLLVLRSVLCG